jgi:hypothetical protein
MDKLEIEGRTYKNVTVLPFLLSETASINAAFLPNKALGTSGRYEGILRGSQGWCDCIAIGDARTAHSARVRGRGGGCWRGLGCTCSGAGQDGVQATRLTGMFDH